MEACPVNEGILLHNLSFLPPMFVSDGRYSSRVLEGCACVRHTEEDPILASFVSVGSLIQIIHAQLIPIDTYISVMCSFMALIK